MPKSCIVVDYGLGHVFSVTQALKRIDVKVELTRDHDRIRNAERLILPGVGAFGRASDRLVSLELDKAIIEFVDTGRPFLGICVGMQLLMEHSQEFGVHSGLGLFKGSVEKICASTEEGKEGRIPVIGWNTVQQTDHDRWLRSPFSETHAHSAYYFVHSFACKPNNDEEICATAKVGNSKVVAAIRRDNILGVQFHPERSSDSGLAFLASFCNIDACGVG
jgi:glutamine amidotransferase